MAEQHEEHWRFTSKRIHCGCEILPESGKIDYIVIARIEWLPVGTHKVMGKEDRDVYLAHFAPNPYTNLPKILVQEDIIVLRKWFNLPDKLSHLKDIPVKLYRTKVRNPKLGMQDWGLRIHKDKPTAPPAPAPTAPKAKIVLTAEHEKFKDCKAKVASAEFTVEKLREWFEISAEVEALLTAE